MMDIVAHDTPEYPLVWDHIGFSPVGMQESSAKVICRPACQDTLDHFPGCLQPTDQRRCIVLRTLFERAPDKAGRLGSVTPRLNPLSHLGTLDAHIRVNPADTPGDD